MTAGTTEIIIRDVAWSDEGLQDAMRLRSRETLALYSADELRKQRVRPLEAADVREAIAAFHDERIVATGALTEADAGTVEVSRVGVHPDYRRSGLARRVLDALESRARTRGYPRLVLQTGFRQHGAIALYEGSGWTRIPPYGPYADDDIVSVCFEKRIT